VTLEGRQATFKHELGALYVACLLLDSPREPLHAVALALKAKGMSGPPPGPDEVLEQRSMGLKDAAKVRALWRCQRELEEVTEYLRQSSWLSRHGAERCARAVAVAIKRFHARLAGAVDAEGKPHPGVAGVCPAPARASVDSLRPGRRTRRAAGSFGPGRLLHLRTAARRGLEWRVRLVFSGPAPGRRGLPLPVPVRRVRAWVVGDRWPLMVLPTLVVGNELLILGGVVVAVGGWFLAHRHGHLRGLVAASTQQPSPGPNRQ
jgi:hypothetical protein